MAKSRKVFIEVIVDDKGTTQRLAVDANKLEKALAGSNKKTKDADRALRGAANMSSNTTKNFSKMTQGISGGIVPAYAELAARVFAVTAAFRFLQEAADTRNLVVGQQAFGALMGTNYAGITKALQDATDGQLRFAEAAQATAIGTAAGLSAQQLTGLATAAKNVSFALGRDLTDSFNRLIRGVTKAEPELLDELGIILRLDPAVKAYKDQIGAVGRELTAFERSQAVANFVLEEAERKFNRIAQVMDKDAFAIAQFGKAFDDVLKELKIGIANSLTPVLKFLTANVSSLIAVLGLLALPLVRSVLPNLDAFAENAKNGAAAAKQFADNASKDFDRLSARAAVLGKTSEDLGKQALKMATSAGLSAEGKGQNTAAGFLAGGDITPTNRGRAAAEKTLKGAEKQLLNSEKVKTGILKGFNAQQVADLRTSYKLRERILKGHELQVKRSVAGMKLSFDTFLAGVQLKSAKAFGFMATQAKRGAKLVNLAFKGIGFLGFALLLADLGKMAFEAFFPMSEEAKKAKAEVEKLTQKNKELAEFLTDVNKLSQETGLLNLTESIQQLGGAVRDADVKSLVSQINQLSQMDKNAEGFKEFRSSILETTKQLALLNPEFKALFEAAARVESIDGGPFIEIARGMAEASAAAASLVNASKAVEQEINTIINTVPQAPLENLRSAFDTKLTANIQLLAEADEGAVDREFNKLQAQLTAAENRVITRRQTTGRGRSRRTTITKQLSPDLEKIEEVNDAIEKLFADQDALSGQVAVDKNILERLNTAASKQLERLNEIAVKRTQIAEIDKVSQSFEAQRERTNIRVLDAQSKVLTSKNAELSAETALGFLKEKGKSVSQEQLDNAQRAVDNAKEATKAANAELVTQEKLRDIEQIKITAAERRLEIQLRINEAENALARARIAQERGTTAGVGTIGKSVADIATEKRLGRENNIISQRKLITDGILKAETKRGELEAKNDIQGLTALDQEIEGLRIKGEQLDRNLEKEQNAVLIDIERGRLRLLENADRLQTFSFSTAHEAAARRILDLENEGRVLSIAEKEEILSQNIELEEQEKILKGMENIRSTVESSMNNAFMSIVDGSKSAKEAFADMAKSILASIAKMIIELLVMKAIQATIGFFGGGPVPAGRNGMISEPAPGARRGGILQGYSTGGIARGRQAGYPAILHGTEAVVPLPNKKEIPVDIRGGTGNVNNISITVNSDGTTREQGSNSTEQSKQLGKAISAAVQDELHKQKRPGGILSPFGAAS